MPVPWTVPPARRLPSSRVNGYSQRDFRRFTIRTVRAMRSFTKFAAVLVLVAACGEGPLEGFTGTTLPIVRQP